MHLSLTGWLRGENKAAFCVECPSCAQRNTVCDGKGEGGLTDQCLLHKAMNSHSCSPNVFSLLSSVRNRFSVGGGRLIF